MSWMVVICVSGCCESENLVNPESIAEATVADPVFLGRRIRSLRVRLGVSQAELAKRLGISSSYLNLLEHDRRPVTAPLLLELSRVLDVDLRVLAAGSADAELVGTLTEIFSEPLFEDHPLTAADVRALVAASPDVARAI